MKIFLYISYYTYIKKFFLLVICIAENLIWTTLKAISYFDFFTLRFQIFK